MAASAVSRSRMAVRLDVPWSVLLQQYLSKKEFPDFIEVILRHNEDDRERSSNDSLITFHYY